MLKSIQYVSFGLLITIFMEGMFTLGSVFHFETYNAFAWITQGVIIVGVVTTAIRIAQEEGK